jgi:hypothetical protein
MSIIRPIIVIIAVIVVVGRHAKLRRGSRNSCNLTFLPLQFRLLLVQKKPLLRSARHYDQFTQQLLYLPPLLILARKAQTLA